jgi:hypothetical protein
VFDHVESRTLEECGYPAKKEMSDERVLLPKVCVYSSTVCFESVLALSTALGRERESGREREGERERGRMKMEADIDVKMDVDMDRD